MRNLDYFQREGSSLIFCSSTVQLCLMCWTLAFRGPNQIVDKSEISYLFLEDADAASWGTFIAVKPVDHLILKPL